MSVEDETWDRPSCEFCGITIPYGKKLEHGRGICKKKPPTQELLNSQEDRGRELKKRLLEIQIELGWTSEQLTVF